MNEATDNIIESDKNTIEEIVESAMINEFSPAALRECESSGLWKVASGNSSPKLEN